MNNGFSKIFVAIFFIALLVSLPVNPLAVPSAGAQVFDPNTNLGKQLVKEVRGDTYLTKEYSDSTAESTFGLPEWIPDDNGNYKPYIIMENNDAYVIENKYLPMGINKSNCMTTFYLNNENILDGADTLIENQYWEVYHKENETDNYQLLDTSSWDCDTSFNTSSKQFSIFTTWDKSHGDIPLAQSQYDTTSTNSTGTFYFKTLSETTNNPTMSQQVITNSTGTFTVDVWTDNFTTTTQNIPVIPDELISTFEVEYRYMLETGDVESFTRIINNDANMENHYFQFVNKFDGVNYNSFNLGDDIEFTDASYIGSYYATAENVPDKYIQIAEQGYPLYYSLEKGEEWWTGAGATIYMDGAEKKLNAQVDFGKDRTPLPLNTLQELDPTFSATHTTVKGVYSLGSNSCAPATMAISTATDYTVYLAYTGNSGGTCSSPSYQWDVSSISNTAIITDVDLDFTVSQVGSPYGCDIYDISNDITSASASTLYTDIRDGTNYVNNDTSCTSTGAKSFDLGSSADTEVSTALTGDDLFGVGVTFDTWSRDGTNRHIKITTSTVQLTVTYELPTVTAPPTNLAGADASTSAINLSWTAPSTASASIPAVTGYRVQSSDFAYANSSLPTGRSADSDTYGALTGDVDMVNANLYLSMNGTQQFGTDNGIGSSADGTNNGATTGVTGKLSNAWDFDGTNDWVDLGTGLNSYIDGNPFTISAWAYVTATNISDRTVIGKQIAGYSSPYHVLNLRAYSGDWALTTNNASTYTGCTNAIDSTGWTHLAVQYDGTSSFTLYENGVSACTFSASNTNWSSSYWSIGNGEGTTRYFNDKIDQVLFYDSDSVSISDLYNSGSGTATPSTTNLIAHYDFDDSSLTNKALESDIKMLDESYRGNHATLIPAPATSTTTDDFSSDGFTHDATVITAVSGGVMDWNMQTTGVNVADSSYKTITEVSDTAWVMTFDFTIDTVTLPSNNDGFSYYIGLHDSNVSPVQASDAIAFAISLGSGNTDEFGLVTRDNAGFQDANPPSASDFAETVATGTYYVKLVRNSAILATLGLYSDATFETLIEEETIVVSATTDELDTIVFSARRGNSVGSPVLDGTVDNIKIYNGVTEIPIDISKDTDLNFEGTSSADFDGSTHYMTLPSDNTIISTTGAFTLGTWIKPDRIVEITVNEGYSSGFTTVGSTVIIDSNHVKSQNSPTNADHRQHKALGTTLDNEKFLVKFDFDYDSNTSSTLPLALTSSTGNMHTASHDALGVFMDGGNLNIWYKDGSGSYTSSGSTQAISSGTQYYLEFARTSSTTTTLKVFTDSSFTTQHGSTLTQTVPSTVQGLTTLQHGTWTSAGGSSGQTWEIANTKIYDGITSVNDQTIFSYPSSAGSVDFNIEGDDLAFRSGDANNDPIISRTHGMNEGSWNNVAVSRDGSNNFEIFVNGTRVGAVASNSTAINAKILSENYYIGAKQNIPEVDDDFSTDNMTHEDCDGSCSSTSGFGYHTDVTNGKLNWEAENNAGNLSYFAHDSVTLDDSDWVIRFKLDLDTITASTTSPDYSMVGFQAVSNTGWTAATNTATDRLGFGIVIGEGSYSPTFKAYTENDDSNPNFHSGNTASYSDFAQSVSTGTYYVEMIRSGATSFSVELFSDASYSTSIEKETVSATTSIVGLDNFQVYIRDGNGNGSWSYLGSLDNLKIYDGVTSVTQTEYYDGKLDEMYVLSTQSDTVIDNISSRGENSWTDLSYNTGGTGTTYSHTGISGGSGTYQSYRVSAHNSVGLSGFDLAEESTSSTPSVPQSLAVAPQMNGDTFENKLTWSNPASEGGSSISSFKVYRGTSSGFTANSGSLIATLGDVFQYTNSGLDGRTSYYYIVSAVNTQGEGTKTSEVQGTTKNFNVIVKGVRFDNSTALAGYVLQTNSTSANNKFTFNSTGFTIGRTLSDGTIDGSDRMTGLYGNQNFTMFDTGNSFTVKKIVNKNIAENKVTNDSWVHAQSNVFDIDCSSNGAGSDVRLYVNGTIGHVQTMTTPSCDSDNIITWDSTFTAHGATTGVGDVSLNSLVIAEVLTTGKFGVNAQSLTYGLWNSTSQSTISTTTLGTTYSAPEITSAVLPVSKPTVTTIYNMTMTLDTIVVAPSGGGGGGGGGSPSEGGILGGLQEFIDETFEFNMASKIHKVELGQTITDSISVSWNQPEEVNIIGIDAGRYNSWFGFQKTPFTLLGDSEGFSNAKIPYKIRIPEVYCDDTTGRTMCAEPILYEVPVLVTGQVNDEVFRGETVVKIDLSKTVQPALFAIFLAFAGGIGAIVYRARASSSSSKPSGKRTPKKKGSFLRELNKDYKK